MYIASAPLGLVATQAPMISSNTGSAEQLFFQKAAAVVMIFKFVHLQEKWRDGAYTRDKLNIQAKAPSLLLSKSSVQNKGAYFREITVQDDFRLKTCEIDCRT